MKKILLILFAMVISVQALPASAAQSKVQVGSTFSATFDNNIRFNGQDCIKVKFKYKAASGLSYPSQVVSLGLYKLNGDDAGGFLEFKIGDTYGLGQGGEPNSGTKAMTLCRTARTELEDPDCDEVEQESYGSSCEYEDIPGVKPGKYFFESNVIQLKPFLTKSSSKVFVTIGK
jgi:hypothetical protein